MIVDMHQIHGLCPVLVEFRARLRPHRQRHLQGGAHDSPFLQAPLGHLAGQRPHEGLVHIDESLVEADRHPLLQFRIKGVVLDLVARLRVHLCVCPIGRLSEGRLLLRSAQRRDRQEREGGSRPFDGM
ncbi:Uncharacterised protein [Mycobacteroides abscessus subsp. massiliense]|nr:Uncharacterised protein [Mycobacteroides abscessus subsp. massiliense]